MVIRTPVVPLFIHEDLYTTSYCITFIYYFGRGNNL